MAKKQAKKNHDLSSTEKISIGVGLTTAAVAAAGTYFLYGSKNAAKNRKKVKSWMLKAKAEVLEQLEEASEMTREEYEDLVNNIAKAYSTLQTASQVDIREFKKEMLEHWNKIEKVAKPKKVAKKAKKVAKKAAKKATKKTAQKATKKATKKKK